MDATIVVVAIMRAAGLAEVRVPEELLVDMDGYTLTVQRDIMRDYQVFRLTGAPDVVEGEVVPTQQEITA